MKRICIISMFILLASCISACCSTGAQTAKPTRQPGVLSLDMPAECRALTEGLCLVSEPGEWLGEGKTTIINQKPEATFLGQSTALQIKVEEWTLIFDPGENKPFSVGMTFPDAKLYPQGKNVGMTIEHGDKKCDVVEGGIHGWHIAERSKRRSEHKSCLGVWHSLYDAVQWTAPGNPWASKASFVDEVQRADPGLQFAWQTSAPGEYPTYVHIGNPPVIGTDGIIYGLYEVPDLASVPITPAGGEAEWATEVAVPQDATGLYILLSAESGKQRLYANYAVDITDK